MDKNCSYHCLFFNACFKSSICGRPHANAIDCVLFWVQLPVNCHTSFFFLLEDSRIVELVALQNVPFYPFFYPYS